MKKEVKNPELIAKEINETVSKLNHLIHEGLLTNKLLIIKGHKYTGERTELSIPVGLPNLVPYYIKVEAALKV